LTEAPRNPSEFVRVAVDAPMFTVDHPDAVMPSYATAASACFDITSIMEGFTLYPGEIVKCRTGLRLNPVAPIWRNHYLMLFARSGLASKGISLANGVGIVDSDYRDEIMVLLHNTSRVAHMIRKGDRVAQGMVWARWNADLEIKDADRNGGFGSTGR
jgi:dUTP pyrophosphatase